MKKIAVLAGDGIGPEIVQQALKALDAISLSSSIKFKYEEALIGGAAYKEHKNHFPNDTKQICKDSDAVLFGSVGGPVEATSDINHPEHIIWKDSEKNSLLGLRKEFNFAVNLRPCKIYPELSHLSPLKSHIVENGVNFMIVRELVGDVYFGEHKTALDGLSAFDEMSYTKEQILKPVKFTFDSALKQKQNKNIDITVVDKANVLDTSRLWRKVTNEYYENLKSEKQNSNLKLNLNFMFVDNAVMQLILNPKQFQYIITSNLFGDILSDAASVIPGSLGLMPSASLSDTGLHMYEPSGGSAPTIANMNIANPIGQILSAAMMLDYSFGLKKERQIIESSVEDILKKGYRTQDIFSKQPDEKLVGTNEIGTLIANQIISNSN